jgi:predicted  nucleic acid-binding Zn-ribbon protein
MTISTAAINRISISELPSATTLKGDDYLLLQSDGVSSKIQISDVKLTRSNLNFYNEIVDLNRLTADHTQQLQELSNQLSTPNTQGENTPINLDEIKQDVGSLKSDIKSLQNSNITSNTRVEKINTTLTKKIDQISADLIGVNESVAGVTSSSDAEALTEFVGGANIRLTELESKVTKIEQTLTTLQKSVDNLQKTVDNLR